MKRTDIERMISLADDRYIDEIFQDKITGKRRNIFVTFTAVAAALALTAGGIGYLVSTADKSNDITTDIPAVSMNDTTDNTKTEPVMQNVSSSDFFKNKSDYPANFYIEWSSEFYGDKQMSFDETYVKTILPFSAEGYSKTRDQFYLYTDENNIPFGASIYFESPFDENASPKIRSISVNVCDKGKLSSPFSIEEFEPINYMHTDIYGFDDTEGYSYTDVYESVLTAYFTAGGSEYSVSTTNLSAEETMQIVESLIQSGFSAKDFDMSMGGEFEHETLNINFNTANSIEPFAGFVPVVDGVLYLYNEEVIYSTEKMNGKLFSQYMAVVYYDKTDDGDRVMLEYYTSGWVDKTPFDNTLRLSSIMQDSLNNFKVGDEYRFTLDCGEFMINVTAKCTSDKLWKYIDAIKGNDGVSSDINSSNFDFKPFGTLAEANKLEPFAGYIPTVKEIGDLKIYTGGGSEVMTAETEEDGRVLNICYQSEVKTSGGVYGGYDFKAISTMYTEKKYYIDTTDPVISVDQLPWANLDDLKKDGIRPDGRVCYRFIIDCGTCYINVAADCLPEEMRDYLMAVALQKTGVRMSNGINLVDSTLSAANKIRPFAGYIPQSESFGSLKLSAVSEGYFDGNASPCLIHMVYVDDFNSPKQMLTAHFYSDYKAVFLDEPNVSAIPLNDITPEKAVPGKSLLVDCGDFKIFIGASSGCSKEDIWRFINGVKGLTTYDAGYDVKKLLTMGEVKELAKKGDELTWSDFEAFSGKDVGFGLYIMAYDVEGTDFTVLVGGVPNEKPMYIYLKDGEENQIDIRYDSIDGFLSEKMLTTDKIKELAKKGDDLMWDDFDGYLFSETGSGLYIRMYNVKGGYTLAIGGGGPDKKPMYINLSDGNGNHIDIRYDSVDDFFNEN